MNLKRLFALCIAVAAMGLEGCASVTSGKMQTVSVHTHSSYGEVRDANCTLTNDKGSWFVSTPGSAVIQKSFGDLAVDCKKRLLVGTATFASNSNAGVWGNILVGGLIGYAVDASSGAGFDYPSLLNVRLNGDYASLDVTPPIIPVNAPATIPAQTPAAFQPQKQHGTDTNRQMAPPANMSRPCPKVVLSRDGVLHCG